VFGEETGDAQSVGIGDPQLRARVRAFLAQDQPGARRPSVQWGQAGGLGDPGPVAGFDLHTGLGRAGFAGLVGRRPRCRRQSGQGGVYVEVGEAGPDGELHALLGEVGGELLGCAGGVGAHQHGDAPVLVGGALRGGQLGECGVEYDDVIGGGVRAGLARSQQLGDRFPTTVVTVIDEPEQRVEPESLLPRAGRVLLVGVRGDQGGVEIDHYLSALDRGPGHGPDPLAGRRPGGADRGEGVVGIRGQPRDQPRHRRVRGDRAEHPGLGAQHRDITGGVPAERDRDREIGHDLPRIMRRERQPPRPEPPRQLPRQSAAPGGLDQQHPPACDTSDSPPAITDNQGRKSLCFTRGVPLNSDGHGLDNHDPTVLSRHFRASGARVSLQDQR
jgi:hypothetical protein